MSKTKKKRKTPPRHDGRVNTTIYLFPETIKNLKMAALDEARNAYEIAEEAITEWLKRKTKSK